MEPTAYLPEWRALDYRAISRHPSTPHTPLDRYLKVRAELVLGRYDRAEEIWRRERSELPEGSFIDSLLEKQLRIYRRVDLTALCSELMTLADRFPEGNHWRGEYHFILGYLHNLLDEYRQGSRHHRLAAEIYRAEGLEGCEATAAFNLCVSYDHLNEREKFDQAFSYLESLEAPAASLWKLRMQAYRKTDAEDYRGAVEDFRVAMALCRAEERRRDEGGIACALAHALLRLGNENEFRTLIDELAPRRDRFTPSHRNMLDEMEWLEATPLLSRAQAKQRFASWIEKAEGVHLLYLAELLLDRLLKGQDYETVVHIARRTGQIALAKQHALSIVDSRFHEITALARLGRFERATSLLNAYRADAETSRSAARTTRAHELETEIRRLRAAIELPTSRDQSTLVLHPTLHRAELDGHVIDLSGKPAVERFLALLISGGPLSLEETFQSLYGETFHPERHARRLHSLVDRTRRILGGSDRILRRNQALELSSTLVSRIAENPGRRTRIDRRREAILSMLTRAKRAVSVAELETAFGCSRRTLQLDLAHLLTQGNIASAGTTKARRYFLEVS